MRIVAGRFGGRRLASPRHDGLRPTSDKVRQALFNTLEHGTAAFSLHDAKVLDLFAGTGALGLEALSRGASYCLFVEIDADARGLIRENVDGLGLGGTTRIYRRDATKLGPAVPPAPFDLLLADPPYDRGLGEAAITAAIAGGWLRAGAVVVLEEREDAEIVLPPSLHLEQRRVYGDTQVLIARHGDGVADNAPPATSDSSEPSP